MEEDMQAKIAPVHRNKASAVSLIAGILPWFFWLSAGPINARAPDLFYHSGYPIVYLPYLFLIAPPIPILITFIAGKVSLSQIEKSGESGKGLATTGIILAVLGGIAYLPMFAYIAMSPPWYF
jgi:hypothetical protein